MRGGLSAAAHSRAITETPPLIRLRSEAADTFFPPEEEGFPNKNAPSQTRDGAFYMRFTA